ARARPLLDEALQQMRRTGDVEGLAFVLNNLGQLARTRGDYPTARSLLNESLELFRDVSKPLLAWALTNLGNLLRLQGDLVAAERTLREGLQLSQSIGAQLMVRQGLAFNGILAVRRGELARGVRLLGTAGQE